MITLLTFWVACEYKKSPEELYIGTILVDLGVILVTGIIATRYLALM